MNVKAGESAVRNHSHPRGDRIAACREIIARGGDDLLEGRSEETSVWSLHEAEAHVGLLKTVKSGDVERLASFFADIHQKATLVGYDQGGLATRALDAEQSKRDSLAASIRTSLECLAAALGVCRLYNPEQPGNFPQRQRSMDEEHVAKSLDALGAEHYHPVMAPGLYGLGVRSGVLSQREVLSLGYVREIHAHLATAGRTYSQIVEIGGGLGRVAFRMARAQRYSIIDLPAVGLT